MLRKGLLASALVASSLVWAQPAFACPSENQSPPELTPDAARNSVVCLINERRHKAGVKKVRSDTRLAQAAQTHSDAMDADNFFAHDSPNGGGPLDRVRASGYLAGASAWGVGENIRWAAGGQATPGAAVRAWMKSPPHREAMLSGRYRHLGVGVAVGSPTGPDEDGAIYTADFGYRH